MSQAAADRARLDELIGQTIFIDSPEYYELLRLARQFGERVVWSQRKRIDLNTDEITECPKPGDLETLAR